MHLIPLLSVWLSILDTAQSAESSAGPVLRSNGNGTSTTIKTTPSSPAEFILHHAIASKLASGPASGVRKMSADEGEKFFFEDWYFENQNGNSDSASGLRLRGRDLYHRDWNGSSSLSTEPDTEDGEEDEDEYDYTSAQFIAQSFPFEPSFSQLSGGSSNSDSDSDTDSASDALFRLEARNFECPSGTSACAYITVVTVTVHSTVMVSTVTYSTSPVPSTVTSSTSSSTSTSKSSQTTATETTDSLAPPARPTNRSTATSVTTGDDVCPTGFYACSAVYHGGCCRTGRNCDTTSCPTTSSTTMTSNGVTIVAPVASTTENAGGSGSRNRCANGWFSCADTVFVVSEPPPIMSDAPQKPLPFVYQFAAGAVAGVSEVPIGRDQDSNTKTAIAGAEHYNGMFDCFRKIVKHEGASRLYRGISAPILMEAPKRATKFAANDSWGTFYRGLFGVEKQTQGLATLTGATAGATEAFVVVPFELVKIRLQDKAQAHKYNGMFDVVKKIVAQEGPMALYNGLESTMWRHILWNAGYFGCIFQVRAQLPAVEPGNKSQQTRNDLIAGTIGGITGTVLNTPMDVVKSRIQNTSKVAGQTPKYNWAWPAIGTVMKEEGFSALYKGFTPKVLRLGPGGGILLVVFTGVMDFFRGMRGE
ncbi:hypothetical protein PENANT_c012G01461 [Penicillium antarcticum]|uniref:Mitochondrial thiamine pyrophosphate carrier 1 n=1 Tax=Penicillium antarcticum TaxID=416450 RepID=A0A1V6Q680_9EURO|nr:hypothetical protein PENANT_c012G01461 [Penicillium antarcticum]